MTELFEMIESLAIIVKNNSDLVDSIVKNLSGARDHIKSAEKNLIKAQAEHVKGNKKIWCITAMVVCITGCVMFPILRMF